MKPLPDFQIHSPRTLTEALGMLRDLEEAKPISGGTDLLPLLRDRAVKAKHLVDLSLIRELTHILEGEGEISIGATTTISEIEKSQIIAEKALALKEAASSIGSLQIRRLGTIGGNLCNASPAADSAPALLVLNAVAEIASADGTRVVPVKEVFAGPKVNSLGPNELLTEVRFPTPSESSSTSFQKLGRRRGYTLAQVNAAALLEFDGPVCCDARIALGAVASTPLRMYEAEEKLWNRRLTTDAIEEAAALCHGLVKPVDDVRASAEYRRAMSCVLVKRALTEAWERGRRLAN